MLLAVLQALGKVAKVLEIDNDGDLQVVVDGFRWLMSPVSCTLVHDPHRQSQEPSFKETQSSVSKMGNCSPLIEVPILLQPASSSLLCTIDVLLFFFTEACWFLFGRKSCV